MEKTISVIVPVYNCARYLKRCVDSILSQTYQVQEVLLIDDGSDDGSGRLCDELEENEEIIRVVHQPNQGVSFARNAGIDIAQGMYLAFVDADDELPSDAFESLISVTDLEAELYLGSCLILGENREPDLMFGSEKEYSGRELACAMMCEPKTRLLMSGVWGKLFVAEIVRTNRLRFDVHWQNGEDGLFIAAYLNYVKRAVNILSRPPVYYLYRYCPDERISAVSAFYPDFFEFHLAHSEKLYDLICEDHDRELTDFFHKFMNGLIIYFVWAYAYRDFFETTPLFQKLDAALQSRLVGKAVKSYKREHRSQSIVIPLAIYLKNVDLLAAALKRRAVQYQKNHKKQELLKSVYRKMAGQEEGEG